MQFSNALRVVLPVAVLALLVPAGPLRADLNELIQQAQSANVADAIKAVDKLDDYGEQAAPAVPVLIKLLEHESPDLRARAARTLAAIGPAAAEAVPALTARISAETEQTAAVRAYSAYALGRIGDKAAPAIPQLVKAVVDEDELVRRAVIGAFRGIKVSRDITIPLLVRVLEEADPRKVMPALHTLAESGEEAVPFLKEALQHEKACYWACIVVSEIGLPAKETIPLVARMLEHQEPECRLQAVMTLGKMGPEAKAYVPQIIQRLREDNVGVKYAAAYALGEIGDGDEAWNALQESVRNDDLFLRMVSAWSLVQLKPTDMETARQATLIVIEGLKSKDKRVISMAARALAAMKAPSEDVAPALAAALENADPQVIDQAILALSALGKDAVPRVQRGLQNEKLRIHAVEIIKRIGPDAAGAVPDLVAVLEKEATEPEFRREANFALGAIGPDAAPAIPVLLTALKDRVPEVRYSACYALGKIGPAASSANARLKELADNPPGGDTFLKLASVWALIKINPKNPRVGEFAAPILAEALSDPREHIRQEAAAALGELGPSAQPYLGRIRELLKDDSMGVRAAAAEALTQLGG